MGAIKAIFCFLHFYWRMLAGEKNRVQGLAAKRKREKEREIERERERERERGGRDTERGGEGWVDMPTVNTRGLTEKKKKTEYRGRELQPEYTDAYTSLGGCCSMAIPTYLQSGKSEVLQQDNTQLFAKR